MIHLEQKVENHLDKGTLPRNLFAVDQLCCTAGKKDWVRDYMAVAFGGGNWERQLDIDLRRRLDN